MVLSLRKKEKIRVRQPLGRILIPTLSEPLKTYVDRVAPLIQSEVNVKAIEWLDTSALTKQIKPNFKTIGPKYGAHMKGIAAWVNGLNSEEIAVFEQNKGATFSLGGHEITLDLGDVEISTKDVPGWAVASEGILTVALDVEITPELASEGVAREVVNRIQNARKDGGFEVTDRIQINYQASGTVHAGIVAHHAYICEEVLADAMEQQQTMNEGIYEEIEALNDFIFTLTKTS